MAAHNSVESSRYSARSVRAFGEKECVLPDGGEPIPSLFADSSVRPLRSMDSSGAA